MKRIFLLVPLLLALAGCTITMHNWPTTPDGEVPFVRLLTKGTIYAPLLNGHPFGYNAYAQPGEFVNVDFSGGRDQYGEPWGLSDPVRFTVTEVLIRCDEKTEDDTIFWPSAEWPVPHLDNSCVWFPGWTAPIETISGLPIPFYPLSGYPWDACHGVGKHGHALPDMPSQEATLTVTAKAEVIRVEFVCPAMDEPGQYVVDMPGATPTEQDRDSDTPEFELAYHVDEPGTYTVTWTEHDGPGEETWEFEIPVDWFYIDGQWTVKVGPTGTC